MSILFWAFCCSINMYRISAQYGFQTIYKNGYFVDVRPGREIASAPGGYGSVATKANYTNFEDAEGKALDRNKLSEMSHPRQITPQSRSDARPSSVNTDIFIAMVDSINRNDSSKEGQQGKGGTSPRGGGKSGDIVLPGERRIPHVVQPSLKNLPTVTNEGRIAEFKGDLSEKAQLPFPNCFINERGFLCCNRDLLKMIDETNLYIMQKNYSECNTHVLVRSLQRNAEEKFKTTFEIIVSPGDFASKSHFRDNLVCKDFINGKYVLIYATPVPYVLGEENTPLSDINNLGE